MTNHPGDNADNRFRAFWAGLLGFVSFGVVLLLALKAFGPEGGEAELTAVEQQVVDVRNANLAEVQGAQSALVSEQALGDALAETTSALAGKTRAKTELVVPNSPTFFKQMKEAQKQQGQPESGDAPAEDKPAEEKPEN